METLSNESSTVDEDSPKRSRVAFMMALWKVDDLICDATSLADDLGGTVKRLLISDGGVRVTTPISPWRASTSEIDAPTAPASTSAYLVLRLVCCASLTDVQSTPASLMSTKTRAPDPQSF